MRKLNIVWVLSSIAFHEPVLSQGCPSEWIQDQDSCYKALTDETNWYDARRNCEALGAELASIRSQEEWNFVKGQGLLDNKDNEYHIFWIGGQFTNKWSWTDGDDFTFRDWNPKNDNGFCLKVEAANPRKWKDEYCFANHRALCKKSGSKIQNSEGCLVKNQNTEGCGSDWSIDPKTGSCYKLVVGNMTWYYAWAKCLSLGAELASIRTNEENTFVVSTFYDEWYGLLGVWLGGNNLVTDDWVWTDGSKFTYMNWAQGEPNNKYGDEWCSMAWGGANGWRVGSWNDIPCDSRVARGTKWYGLSAICKIPGNS